MQIGSLSGSLTNLIDGTSYLIAGNNVTITSQSNGSVVIASTGGGGPAGDQFFLSTTDGSIYTSGSAAFVGPGDEWTVIDSPADKGTDVFFYVSGSISGMGPEDKKALFGGDVVISGSIVGFGDLAELTGTLKVTNGISGSLTHLDDGTSYLIAGNNVSIVSQSNGSILISSTDATTNLVYQPGGTPGGNVHTTWSSLMSAFNTTVGNVTITVDPTYGQPVVDSGVHDFESRANIISDKYIFDFPAHLSLPDGAVLKDVRIFDNIDLACSGTTTSNLAISDRRITSFRFTYVTPASNIPASAPIYTVGSSDLVLIDIDQPTIIDNGLVPFADLGSSGDLTIYATRATVILNDNFVIGTAGSFFTLYYDSSLTTNLLPAPPTNPGFGGTTAYNKLDNSRMVAYDDTSVVGTLGSTDAQGAIDALKLRWASTTSNALYTTSSVAIRGDEVIDAAQDKGPDVFFYVSGSKGSKDTSVAGTSLFGGDLAISGSLFAMGDKVEVTGSLTVVGGISGSLTNLDDGTSYLVAGNNITITSQSNGSVLIAVTSTSPNIEEFFDSTTDGSIFTSGSAAFVGGGDEWGVVDSPVDKGTDVFFYVSGSIGSKDTTTKGVALFGGDVVVSGSLFTAGDVVEITGSLTVTGGISGSLTNLADGTSYLIAGTNISIVSASNGSVTISSTFAQVDDYFDSTTVGSIFTSGSAAFVGDGDEWGVVDSPADKGTDVFFYVSGAMGSKDTTTKGVALFGGDVVISGTLFGGSPLKFGSDVKISGSITQGTNAFATGSMSTAYGSGTFAVNDYTHAEGSTTFAADVWTTITAEDPPSSAWTVSDASLFNVGDKIVYVYNSTANVNQYHVTEVTSVDTVANAVTASSTLAIDYSSFHAGAVDPIYVTNNFFNPGYVGVTTGISVLFNLTQKANASTFSHAEGSYTLAAGQNSHAEGRKSVALGAHSHAEGVMTYADQQGAHAEGNYSRAVGVGAHAEGQFAVASANDAHAEGRGTLASGQSSHAEGNQTTASGDNSHAEGQDTIASGQRSHAEGWDTRSRFIASHAEGYQTVASGSYSHAEGHLTVTSGSASHAEGYLSIASGSYSHAEGYATLASGDFGSHAEGSGTTASGEYSHAEGDNTTASGQGSHAEGVNTTAAGPRSHAEGYLTFADNYASHAEGNQTVATGYAAHAEGDISEATGDRSHAEGISFARGNNSHSEGYFTVASGSYSHAGGMETIASGTAQTVIGQYNLRDNDFSLFVVGNGTADDNANRSDVFRVNQSRVDVTGSFAASQGLSGSLTKLVDGTSYLIAGTNISISSASNGAVTISNTFTQVDDYFDSTTDGSIFTTGSAAFRGTEAAVDSPADKGTDVFFYVSGSIGSRNTTTKGVSLFGGDTVISGTLAVSGDLLEVTGSLIVTNGISGSLTHLANGTSYLIAGTNISITSQSNGSVLIAGTTFSPLGSAYVTIGSDATLTAERALTAGTGLTLTDAGANSTVTLAVNDNIVATITGSAFSGVTKHNAGLSGSLTKLVDGTSYLIAGTNISVASQSNGSILISNTFVQVDDYFDSTTDGSIFTTGSAAFRGTESAIDSPSDKGTDVFFYVSGSIGGSGTEDKKALFGGDVTMSGSIDVKGNTLIGDSSSDTVTFNAQVNSNIIPVTDVTYNLGSSSSRWANIYTGDLHLRNDRGDWTIVEEADYLCVVNNLTGKKYKMMLQPLDEET